MPAFKQAENNNKKNNPLLGTYRFLKCERKDNVVAFFVMEIVHLTGKGWKEICSHARLKFFKNGLLCFDFGFQMDPIALPKCQIVLQEPAGFCFWSSECLSLVLMFFFVSSYSGSEKWCYLITWDVFSVI